MQALLDTVIRRFMVEGTLTVLYPNGTLSVYAGKPGLNAGIHIRTARTLRRLITDPGLAVGECYMDGTIAPLDCSMYDLLELMLHNHTLGGRHVGNEVQTARRGLLRRWTQWNRMPRARRNVAHHYDLGDRLYALFLDADWQYSCAYFRHGDETLETAQNAKKRHIAAKLLLGTAPGAAPLHVLDIGCGWGGLAITLARDYGARVTGITLSQEQLTRARARAEAAGVSDRVRFTLQDYRDPALSGPFDRIVSVGMFEHVGINHYNAFFRTVRRLLAPAGVALVHAIGRSDGPANTNPWLAKYVFPGGYSPALSEVLPAVEHSGLVATDIEILRLHYAETIRHWRCRFDARRAEAAALYDERFCRMFELYLAGSELAFRRQGHMVWQLQMAREDDAVPLTRDYIGVADREDGRVAHHPREDAD